MKKALGQTVRDLKREVNKKVLKVPSIEQKVLDATSNEPWGPHGTVLADIAQASRNYHEYQMIMAVIWKRINDTGKNWRHVYKALTVLEYMVANGTERVIEDIREHAYQIQTLSDFQYIDSSGRDQGNNVRKKSQSLVVLVNDKERIAEVRQKAAANREKYRNTNSSNIYRAGSYSGSGGFEDERYDGRYGSRDEDRNGYGKDREYGNRDDDRYGRYGDSYGRDGYKDDESRGRSRSVDGSQYGSRSRSADRDRDHSYEEDSQHSSRGSAAMADGSSHDGSNLEKRLERKFSEQSIGAPPSYEEAVGAARSPTYSEQGGEILSASSPASYTSPANASQSQAAHNSASQPAFPSPPARSSPLPNSNQEPDSFDEFDPRGSFSAATVASNISPQNGVGEMDFLGSLSESFSSNSLALVSSGQTTSAPGTDAFGDSGSGKSSSSLAKEAFDDPFGDGPFKAIPPTDHLPAQNLTTPQMVVQRQESVNNPYSHQELSMPDHDIDILANILPPTASQAVTSSQTSFQPQANIPSSQVGLLLQNNLSVSQAGNYSQTGETALQIGVHEGPGQPAIPSSFSVQPGQPFLPAGIHSGQHVSQPHLNAQTTQNPSSTGFIAPAGHVSQTGFPSQSGQPTSVTSFPGSMTSSPHTDFQAQHIQQNVPLSGSYSQQMDSRGPFAPQVSSQGFAGPYAQPGNMSSTSSQIVPHPQAQSSSATVPQHMVPASTGFLTSAPQPADDKFKTKSTVWADTLSRGLVNLNISGSKTNPLADIGVDFDAINRKEKRMEKPSTAPTVSNVTMGRAMGAGSGIGRAGAGVLRPPTTPMIGSGMGMGAGAGMGGGPRPAMGMGGYGAGAVNQPMGVGMGMNMAPNMGMGMNMGIGQGGQMQQAGGFPPGSMNMGIGQGGQMQQPGGFSLGSTMPGGYNPMSGRGNYGQQPYGGGYR